MQHAAGMARLPAVSGHRIPSRACGNAGAQSGSAGLRRFARGCAAS